MVFYNNNRVDHAFLNKANIVAIGMGTNAPALVYNNAATAAYINAPIASVDNRIYNFEIVNFNTLGIDNIDFVLPFQTTTSLMNKSATMYYNNARNNCLIENTVKDINITRFIDYGFSQTNFAPLNLNSLRITSQTGQGHPTSGYYYAKYVVCNAVHGGTSAPSWYATENLNGYPKGRTPGHSNMYAGNVMTLNGVDCFFGQYTGYTVDQLNITGAKTAYLNNFNGGNYWESSGGVRVIYDVTNAYLQSCKNISYVNANNVYVNYPNNFNYINGNYVEVLHGNNINVNYCYNLNSYGTLNINANVAYFANVQISQSVSLIANHANIYGGYYVNANLYSNNATSYINNTVIGRFILNHNTYIDNIRNSTFNAYRPSYGLANLKRVNNTHNCNFYVQGMGSVYVNIVNTYNAFRNGNIFTSNTYFPQIETVSGLTQSIKKDAFFNVALYNYNFNNSTNLGPTDFTWYSTADPATYANAFSYFALLNVYINTTLTSRANFDVNLPCGSNIKGTCLVLGNAYNVSSYELRQEVHIGSNGIYPSNGGGYNFGYNAYCNQNGHDTYIYSTNMNNFDNRKFIVMGLGAGSVSYPNGNVAYINAENTALLHYRVPNTYVRNAWMVQISGGSNSLNNNWAVFSNCGPVYIGHNNSLSRYYFQDTPNACIAGAGNYYFETGNVMNFAVYMSQSRYFFIADEANREVHFDVKTIFPYGTYLRPIYLYNTSSTWNKSTSIYINAFDCNTLVIPLHPFIYNNTNLNNAKTIAARIQNCHSLGGFDTDINLYFNNANIYIINCNFIGGSSVGTRANIYANYPTNIVITNCVSPYPKTLAKGTNVNITLTNCTNITVV